MRRPPVANDGDRDERDQVGDGVHPQRDLPAPVVHEPAADQGADRRCDDAGDGQQCVGGQQLVPRYDLGRDRALGGQEEDVAREDQEHHAERGADVVGGFVGDGDQQHERAAQDVRDEHRAAVVPAIHPRARERREHQHGSQHHVAEHAEQDRGLARVREAARVHEQQAAEREVVQAVAEDGDELAPPQCREVALEQQRSTAGRPAHRPQAAVWPESAARCCPTASR